MCIRRRQSVPTREEMISCHKQAAVRRGGMNMGIWKLKRLKKQLGLMFAVLAVAITFSFTVPVHADEPEEIAIDETNFPDPIVRNEILTDVDHNGSKGLSEEEIENTLYISLATFDKPYGKITSLSGLEYLTKVKTFSIYNYSLACELDPGIFPDLQSLTLSGTNVKTLDLCKNDKLRYLELSDLPLTELKTAGAVSLVNLSCQNTKLTTLDVSKNKNLSSLDIGNNCLTSVNLKGAAALEYLSVANNKLKTLEVGSNKNLAQLVCAENKGLYVDLRNNDQSIYVDVENYWYEDSMVVITRTKKDLGWRTLNEKKYYIVDDGGSPKKSHIATEWTKIGTVTYRFDSNGVLQTGVKTIDGKKYLLGKDGSKKTKGLQSYNGRKYYTNEEGVIQTGWITYDGKKHFFFDNGKMASEEWIDGKWYNKDGTQTYKYTAAWSKNAAGKRYDDKAKKFAKNKWVTIDQKQYYFDALGYYVKDAKKVGNSAAAPTKVKANISYRSKSAIMNRLNQIRKEAKKLGLIKKYTPIKWSYELEKAAFIRAAEASFVFSHTRPGSSDLWGDGLPGGCEIIASGNDPISAINLWYTEKDDYIRAHNGETNVGVTGHYSALINSECLGIASFGVSAGRGGSGYKDSRRYATKARNTAVVDVKPEDGTLVLTKASDQYTEIKSVDVCAGQTVKVSAIFRNEWSNLIGLGKWYSLNKNIAKVNSSGTIKGMKKGTTTIVFRDGAYSAKLTVKVHSSVDKLKWKSDSKGKWLQEAGGWYPKDQWLTIKGKKYYAKENGYLVTDQWYGGYYFLSSGALRNNKKAKWHSFKKGSKYGYTSTKVLKNTKVRIDNAICTFDKKGYLTSSYWVWD